MRSITIAALALVATAGLAAGQAGRPDREQNVDRLQAEMAARLQDLEVRYNDLLQRLAAMPGDQRLRHQLAEMEAERDRMQVDLRDRHLQLEHELAQASGLHSQRLAEVAAHVADLDSREAGMERAQAELQNALDVERHQQLERSLQAIHESRARAAESLNAAATELQAMREFSRSLDGLYGDGPRASWSQGDPADSVWRAAREQMNRGRFEAAATLYRRIHTEPRYRQSTYRADALYWHAFALSRTGSDDEAREALDLLAQLVREYPADQRSADTNSLMTTVQTRLARRGNEAAVQRVREVAASDEARIAYERAVQQYSRTDQQSRVARELAVVAATGEARSRALTLDPAVADRYRELALTTGLPVRYSRSLSAQCARDESEIQLIALNSLVRMDSAAALPVLQEVMARRDECAALLRQSALTLIGRLQSTAAQNMLVEAARNDPDEGVRRTALSFLGARNAEQAVGIAEDILSTAGDDDERTWALQVLARVGSPRAWSVLRDYAGRADQSTATRRSAIAALSQSEDATAGQFLRDLYTRVGNDTELKEMILMSAAFRRGGADSAWLFSIAQDRNEDAHRRELAVSALSRNGEVATERFVGLYDGATEKQVKHMVVRVLAERARTESVAADKLIAIARTETDIDLRKAAVLGLPSNDPRARDLLIEILRKR